MDEENKNLKAEIENYTKSGDEAQKQIKSLLRKIDDLESKVRYSLNSTFFVYTKHIV